MDLESVARELYRVPPAQFTAARNARAKQLVADGERDLAGQVRTLAKPSPAAWAVNRALGDRADLRDDIVDLGARLREAGEHPNRKSLTELVDERKALVRTVTSLAVELAQHDDVALSAAARAEVESTLAAAVADVGAAAAAFSARLIRPLQAIGFDEVDVAGAVGGPDAAPLTFRAGTGRRSPGGGSVGDGGGVGGDGSGSGRSGRKRSADADAHAADPGTNDADAAAATAAAAAAAAEHARLRREATREAAEAHRAAQKAAGQAERLADTLRDYEQQADDVEAEVDDLEARLERLRDRQRDLAARVRAATREHRDAVTSAARADRDAERASERAAELE